MISGFCWIGQKQLFLFHSYFRIVILDLQFLLRVLRVKIEFDMRCLRRRILVFRKSYN
jgi:hypothetical protein